MLNWNYRARRGRHGCRSGGRGEGPGPLEDNVITCWPLLWYREREWPPAAAARSVLSRHRMRCCGLEVKSLHEKKRVLAAEIRLELVLVCIVDLHGWGTLRYKENWPVEELREGCLGNTWKRWVWKLGISIAGYMHFVFSRYWRFISGSYPIKYRDLTGFKPGRRGCSRQIL